MRILTSFLDIFFILLHPIHMVWDLFLSYLFPVLGIEAGGVFLLLHGAFQAFVLPISLLLWYQLGSPAPYSFCLIYLLSPYVRLY